MCQGIPIHPMTVTPAVETAFFKYVMPGYERSIKALTWWVAAHYILARSAGKITIEMRPAKDGMQGYVFYTEEPFGKSGKGTGWLPIEEAFLMAIDLFKEDEDESDH